MPFNSGDGPTWDRTPESAEEAPDVESLEPPYDADCGCPKCGCPETRTGQLTGHSGGVSMAMDVPSNVFRVVTCLGCGYSELYKRRSDSDGGIVETFLEAQD